MCSCTYRLSRSVHCSSRQALKAVRAAHGPPLCVVQRTDGDFPPLRSWRHEYLSRRFRPGTSSCTFQLGSSAGGTPWRDQPDRGGRSARRRTLSQAEGRGGIRAREMRTAGPAHLDIIRRWRPDHQKDARFPRPACAGLKRPWHARSIGVRVHGGRTSLRIAGWTGPRPKRSGVCPRAVRED